MTQVDELSNELDNSEAEQSSGYDINDPKSSSDNASSLKSESSLDDGKDRDGGNVKQEASFDFEQQNEQP